VLFAVGMLLGAIKLLFALAAVTAVRRNSRSIGDPQVLATFAALQQQCGSSRAIELCETRSLSTPATLGWRRPLIVLPLAWRTWSEDERRAVLAHEIAHVERGDYLMWLAAHLALVLHFYHPMVHWLAARIRLEQECAADQSAAAMLGSRRSYLTALARLALRSRSSLGELAPSFASTRGTLLQRVERLRLGGAEVERISVWASKFAAAAILLTAGVAASGFRGETIWGEPSTQPAPMVVPTALPNHDAAVRPDSRARG
jgi:beta-lactamase regulating signal transducer with metallopeptidase domain